MLCSSIPGVFVDTTKDTSIVHDISVVGYGVDKETGNFEISNSKDVLFSQFPSFVPAFFIGHKYWLIRNSWGAYWVSELLTARNNFNKNRINDLLRFFPVQGENGFFKLVRGVNNLGIESGTCAWVHLKFIVANWMFFLNFFLSQATPKDTWTHAPLERAFVLDKAKRKVKFL